jgi:hypothetical protein
MNREEIEMDNEVIDKVNELSESAVINEKLNDALTPGYQSEFDPEEAEEAGAFSEDALSEEDAIESNIDLLDSIESTQNQRKETIKNKEGA